MESVGSGADVIVASIAAVVVAWVRVVRGVIHNAGTVGISIAVVVSTLQVKEKTPTFSEGVLSVLASSRIVREWS